MNISAPAKSEYPEYYHTYVQKALSNDLITGLTQSQDEFEKFISRIPVEKIDYRYAPGKWTIKEIILHIIDAERIFAYRALRFARNDKTELPGFDEEKYTPESNATARSIDSLREEYIAVRQATITLFNSFTGGMIEQAGIASGKKISVRAIGFVIAGHSNHHLQVIKERYLGN